MIARKQLHSIIATKLSAPTSSVRLITRRMLFDDFASAKESSILTVVAAAGSGKSTLLAEIYQTLSRHDIGLGWISLDRDDDSPAHFVTYLIAALTRLDSEGDHEELLLQGRTPFRDIEPLLKRLLAHVSTLRREAVLFFDDFQNIQNETLLMFFNKLLSHAPANLRFVIASRQRIPLDLSRFRVGNRLTEVQQEELVFTAQQAREFLKRSHGLELSDADLGLLLDTTEGWPTGIQLAALALRKHSGQVGSLIRNFSGRDRDLSSYLMEVVLRSQPDAVRQFLLATAPLTRMSAPLAEAVSGQPDAAEMIDQLSRSNLFVIALDREGRWYRYHHLFSTFLKEQAKASDPAFLGIVFDRAASWCESQGLMTEAIQYALDGQHYDKACNLITAHAPTLSMWQGDHYTVLEWMRRLPESYHLRQPELALAHAWARAFSRDADQAIAICNSVLSLLRRKGSWKLPKAVATEQALVARVIQMITHGEKDNINVALDLGNDLLKALPEAPPPFLTSSICNTLSYCHFVRQEFELSAKIAAEAYQTGYHAAQPYAAVWANFMHGVADLEMGRVGSASQHAERAVALARTVESNQSYSSAMAGLVSAEVALQRCEIDRAADFMRVGRSFTVMFGPLQPLLMAYRIDARLSALRGDLGQAHRILKEGQDVALAAGQHRLYLNLAIEDVTIHLNTGDLDSALESAARSQLLKDGKPPQDTPAFQGEREALKLLHARLLLAQGDVIGALRLLTTLQQQRSTSARFGLTLRATRALAMWADQRQAEAIRELDKVLSAAAPEQHAYPIIGVGLSLAPVLRAIVERRGNAPLGGDLKSKRRLENTLLGVLLPEERSQAPLPPADAPPSEALTLREIELLRLVDAGLANRQLADALLISESTVKWHLHNIYSKIGVGSRTAAAARARELMLIK